jgi:hypothetical protein
MDRPVGRRCDIQSARSRLLSWFGVQAVLLAALTSQCLWSTSHGSVITFTGNATHDFRVAASDSFTLYDGKDIALNTGFDVLSIAWNYDKATDTAWFGECREGRG